MLTSNSIIKPCLYFVVFVVICCCNKTSEAVKIEKADNGKPIDPKVVVVLGSSTAFGIGANPIDSSWVNLLAKKFTEDNKKVTVINLALAGYTSFNILPNEDFATISSIDTTRNVTKALRQKPNLIIINLPSNDISNNYSDEEILFNYQKITSKIDSFKIPVLITSTQPRNFDNAEKRKRLKTFNDKLNKVYPLSILNLYDSLATPSFYIRQEYNSGDGIHVNNAGHRIIYNVAAYNQTLQKTCGY